MTLNRTIPMGPIDRPRLGSPSQRLIQVACVLLGLPAGLSLVAQAPPALMAQAPPALVEVQEVVAREMLASRSFPGTVIPARRAVVGSAVDGRVEEVRFEEGDLVDLIPSGSDSETLGQPLVQLRTRTIELEVAAARAEGEQRQQELRVLERSLPQEITHARARMTGAKALMNYTQARYRRKESLFRQGKIATQEELDEALSASITAEQAHEAARIEYDRLRDTSEARIAQASAALAVQTEVIRRLEDIQKKYTVRAPFRGFVIRKMTEVGAWVSSGSPVAEVIELDPVEIEVAVPQEFVSGLTLNAPARVRMDALADQLIVGVVHRIVPQADLRSRSFPIKVRVANPQFALKAGMLAQVVLPVGTRQQALLVPKDALVLSESTRTVMVVDTDAKTQQSVTRAVPVEDGIADGDLVEVRGNLRAGDLVVTRGNERLFPGQPVQIRQLGPVTSAFAPTP